MIHEERQEYGNSYAVPPRDTQSPGIPIPENKILQIDPSMPLCSYKPRTMQPSLDQLIQITRTLGHDYDFVRVVLASTPDYLQDHTQIDAEFIEVSDDPEFRTLLHQALRDGLTALGLLGWERKDGTLQTKGGMFPWHDESLKELFDQVSEAEVDQVQELFDGLGLA